MRPHPSPLPQEREQVGAHPELTADSSLL